MLGVANKCSEWLCSLIPPRVWPDFAVCYLKSDRTTQNCQCLLTRFPIAHEIETMSEFSSYDDDYNKNTNCCECCFPMNLL